MMWKSESVEDLEMDLDEEAKNTSSFIMSYLKSSDC